jgi:hypothetical protein
MVTDSRASRRSLLKQTAGKKIRVHAIESHPIQQSPGLTCPMKFVSGALPELETSTISNRESIKKIVVLA